MLGLDVLTVSVTVSTKYRAQTAESFGPRPIQTSKALGHLPLSQERRSMAT